MNLERTTLIGTASAGALALVMAGTTPLAAYSEDSDDGVTHVVMMTDGESGDVRVIGDAQGRVITGDAEHFGSSGFVFGDKHVQTFNDGESHSIEVRIVNGEPTVVVDGKEVPGSQVIHKDGSIIVLDENGKELRTVQIGPMTGDRTFGLHFGEGDKEVWFGDAQGNLLLPEPKVMLGVQLGQPSPALERHLKLEAGTTTIINALYKGLPAHDGGLREYDIITSIDGREPASPAVLRETLAELEPGDTLRLGVISEGSRKTVRVTVTAYDREAMREAELIGQGRGMALFGQNMFGGQLDGSGKQSLFELDFGKIDDINRFFLDDSNRLFEVPKGRMRLELKGKEGESGATEAEVEVQLDSRLSTLDKRLAALEEMIDALLQEAKKER